MTQRVPRHSGTLTPCLRRESPDLNTSPSSLLRIPFVSPRFRPQDPRTKWGPSLNDWGGPRRSSLTEDPVWVLLLLLVRSVFYTKTFLRRCRQSERSLLPLPRRRWLRVPCSLPSCPLLYSFSRISGWLFPLPGFTSALTLWRRFSAFLDRDSLRSSLTAVFGSYTGSPIDDRLSRDITVTGRDGGGGDLSRSGSCKDRSYVRGRDGVRRVRWRGVSTVDEEDCSLGLGE